MWWFLPSAVGEHVSPILNPTPTSLPSHPSALSRCTSFECPVSCIELGLVICFTCGNIHVSMLFSQIIPPSPTPTESKSLFFISVSLLLPREQGRCYHVSKFGVLKLKSDPYKNLLRALPDSIAFLLILCK